MPSASRRPRLQCRCTSMRMTNGTPRLAAIVLPALQAWPPRGAAQPGQPGRTGPRGRRRSRSRGPRRRPAPRRRRGAHPGDAGQSHPSAGGRRVGVDVQPRAVPGLLERPLLPAVPEQSVRRAPLPRTDLRHHVGRRQALGDARPGVPDLLPASRPDLRSRVRDGDDAPAHGFLRGAQRATARRRPLRPCAQPDGRDRHRPRACARPIATAPTGRSTSFATTPLPAGPSEHPALPVLRAIDGCRIRRGLQRPCSPTRW